MSPRPLQPIALAALVVIASLVAGCRVDQAREVATYRKIIDMPPPEATDRPLTLRDALLLANQNNEELSIGGEDYLQALIERRRAVAEFMPTVDLTGTYRRRDATSGRQTSSDSTSNGGGGVDDSTFDVTAGVDYNVFNGFRDVNRYWSDTYLIEQQRNRLLSTQEGVLLDVAGVYYEVLRSEAQVRVLESSLAVQRERLREATGRLEAGSGRQLDVSQTQAQLEATQTTLIDARRDAVNARSLLARLTAAPVREAPLVDAYDLPERVLPLDDYVVTASTSRPDLLASAAAVRAAERDVKVAWGQYYPSVSLNLSAFLYRETIPDDRAWEGLLTANLPLFSAGRIHADVRQAWSFLRQALLVQSALRRQVEQEVRQAFQELSASEARIGSLQAQLRAAELAYRQAEESYQIGLVRNLERVVAQDALLNAQLLLSSEEYDRKVRYLSLLRASGMLRQALRGMADVELAQLAPAHRPTTMPTGAFDLRPTSQPAGQRIERGG